MNPYTREKIENWVGDFCSSDQARQVAPALREHAPAVLVEFLAAACEARGVEPDEIEEADVKAALVGKIARLDVPAEAKKAVPAACALLLGQLEDEGRVGGGRVLGAYARALQEAFDEAASGKKKPIVRPGAKIGRNDPCPCGSGKKYKQCCLKG